MHRKNINSKISVIIPTHNSRGGLKRAIDSALNQTYDNLEIIVIDDNNPDTPERLSTENIMSGYKNNIKVRYLKHEYNKNGAAARNTGIKAAKGDYIAFLDDDDEWLPYKIENQLKHLRKNSHYDCVYCLSSIRGKNELVKPYEGNATVPLLMNRTKMYTPTLMFTQKSLINIGGFNEDFKRHQDYELLINFFSYGYKICCLKEVQVNILGLGGNRISTAEFVDLKGYFLNQFSQEIEKIELRKKNMKRKIIVANYVVVFDSALSKGQFKIAWDLFKKYFPQAPFTFIDQLWFLIKNHLNRKLRFSL